jgi:hypothetical protein
MSTNNSPQTLFRFVSFRNPKLAETTEKNLGFINRPSTMVGFFDQFVQTSSDTSKFQLLLSESKNFESISIKSINELKERGFEDLMNLGKAIVEGSKLSTEEIKLCLDFYHKAILDLEYINKIWDNLFYQCITQKNFYIKEAISYILKAYHVGYVQTLNQEDVLKKINGDDFIAKSLDAQIVLPKTIFINNQTILNSLQKKTSQDLSDRENSLLTLISERNQKVQNLLFESENNALLKSELIELQKRFHYQYEKAYKIALEIYNKENKEKIITYENQLAIIMELEAKNAPAEEINKANEELNRITIPLFEFEYKNELNWEDIYNMLTADSFSLFLIYFSTVQDTIQDNNDDKLEISIVSDEELIINGKSIFFKNDSYSEIFDEIDTNIQQLNISYLNKVSLQKDEFTNLAGVLVPVARAGNQITHLAYVLKAIKPFRGLLGYNHNIGYVNFSIEVENNSWSITHASITAQVTKNGSTALVSQPETLTNITVIDNELKFPQFLVNKFKTISSLKIQIYFSNGRESTLDIPKVNLNIDMKGVLVLKTLINVSDNGNNNTDETYTVGNHFGLKRLGVAEYLKVVQSVHAYVPGEVSNIENVMASELRHKSITEYTRTEDTTTTNKSQEVEKISDTSKTNRTDMQTEVLKEIDKQKSFQAHANFSKDTKIWKLDIGTAFASTNAQHISNLQAVTKSQEITERAMERVQSKISEERIMKIIQEVSLTNVHEFDNRGGLDSETPKKHITGVYRWVDKKMKNQIYNYGLRTMFEFMIPEPAKLHRLAQSDNRVVTIPVDPRKAPAPHNLFNATSATKEILEYWAGIYGVTLTDEPINKQQIFKAEGNPTTEGSGIFFDQNFEIEDDYIGKTAVIDWYYRKQRNQRGLFNENVGASFYFSNFMGNFIIKQHSSGWSRSGTTNLAGLTVPSTFNYQVRGGNIGTFNLTIKLNCIPSVTRINTWKLENFNAIINAYNDAFNEYKLEKANLEAEQKANEDNQKESQANFYRIMEGDMLKHNCIAYLVQNYLTTLGQVFTSGKDMENFKVTLSSNLDQYTAKAKFLEQAFEWSIMDYTFYPYYWADRKQWQEMYLSESIDPLFRSFLQAGLARVIVTVKPGFEKAVQYFLETGNVWFGGDTPVIGDELYMSIAQEMIAPTGTPQGKYWITRIPTTLTILQSGSTGLPTLDGQPLPIFPESVRSSQNFENPTELEKITAFVLDETIHLEGSSLPSTLPNNIINP